MWRCFFAFLYLNSSDLTPQCHVPVERVPLYCSCVFGGSYFNASTAHNSQAFSVENAMWNMSPREGTHFTGRGHQTRHTFPLILCLCCTLSCSLTLTNQQETSPKRHWGRWLGDSQVAPPTISFWIVQTKNISRFIRPDRTFLVPCRAVMAL